jgi:hypothetical protein
MTDRELAEKLHKMPLEQFIKELKDCGTWGFKQEICAEAADRLEHYAKLEEEGRLKELPVTEGDTIYELRKTYCTHEKHFNPFCYKCPFLEFDPNVPTCNAYWTCKFMPCALPVKFQLWMISEIGTRFFLTKEQAEEALKNEHKL